MNPIPLRLPFASLVATTLISACGGGGGSPANATLAPASVAGVVSGSPGALSLGGAAMTVSGPVTVNGKSGTIADVQPGDVIVAATSGQTAGLTRFTATATDVLIEVESSISSLDLAASTVVVGGQTVVVDALTRLYDDNRDDSYSSLTLADFAVSDYVEVSGARQESGAILATRIERKRLRAGQPGYSGIELYGDIVGLDTAARTFTIGSLLVDYASATTEGTLANGTRVEVNGTLNGSLLTASRVETKRIEGDRGSEVEIEGPVSDLDTAAQTFTALGYRVSYAGARVRGVLADGARIEIEGRFDGSDASLIIAREVKVKQRRGGDGRADGEVKGALSAVDAAAGTFDLGGTGYFVDSATVFDRDDSDATLADLRVGDYVEVKFRSTRIEAGRLYATKVAFDDRADGDDRIGEFEIEGSVSAFVDAPGSRQLSINGYVVTPSDSARYYGDRNDNPLTADQFWNGLSVGQRLEVKGTLGAGNAVTGLRFELED